MSTAKTKNKIPVPPSFREVHTRIAGLRRVNLKTVEIDFLKSRLVLLLRGFMQVTPVLMVSQNLYRGVRWSEKPTSQSQLSYPPPDIITSYQRVNRPHQSMFYCSVAREAPFFELGLKPGDHVAMSRWRVNQKILVNNIGYSPSVLAGLGSKRQASTWGVPHPHLCSSRNTLIADFLASEFTRVVPPGNEHFYKFSIAIAEKLYIGPLHDEEFDRLGGILYPTIAMRANSDNLALIPEFVDRFLSLEAVEWIRVDSGGANLKLQVTKLDFADSFGGTGQIEWKGRLPQWSVGSGRTVRVSVEDGKYVVRDEEGTIVEPT